MSAFKSKRFTDGDPITVAAVIESADLSDLIEEVEEEGAQGIDLYRINDGFEHLNRLPIRKDAPDFTDPRYLEYLYSKRED